MRKLLIPALVFVLLSLSAVPASAQVTVISTGAYGTQVYQAPYVGYQSAFAPGLYAPVYSVPSYPVYPALAYPRLIAPGIYGGFYRPLFGPRYGVFGPRLY
jgi:hypothetical protein